jgi:hypothetical protein
VLLSVSSRTNIECRVQVLVIRPIGEGRALPISGKQPEASCRSPRGARFFPILSPDGAHFKAPQLWGRQGLRLFFFLLLLRGRFSFALLTMNTYKHRKPNGDNLSQEPDRPRHKFFTSSSHHRTSEIRTTGRDREDAKHRPSRAHVSDGPLLSSSTPAPSYPSGAQSSATASKAPHNAPTQPIQGYTSHASQKAPHPIPTLPQETHPTAQRHWETPPDPRATSHRTVTAMDKASLMSPDPLRHAEDHYKSSRHRPRHPSTPAPESAEPQVASTWPRPPSFLKKASPEGREREKEQARNRSKEESKAASKAKDKRRAERPQEHISRDQREREPRYEEERRNHKEERRHEREKERQREEQRHDERRHEQRVKDDYAHKSTRDQERRRETKDGHVHLTHLGKDPRLMRVIVKDSDESDNSLTKRPGSIRPRRQHPKDQTMTVGIYHVLRPRLTRILVVRCAYSSAPVNISSCTRRGSNDTGRE